MPKVSVLLAVYNGSDYIKESVDSILDQSMDDLELIVVDDCSTDHTLHILQEKHDRRLCVLANPHNLGQTKSLNRAIKSARGTFIARQDADDVSEIERLKEQVEFLESNPGVGVLGTVTTWISEEGIPKATWPKVFSHADIQTTLVSHCCLAHGSVMMRSEVLKAFNGYDERFIESQDYDLWLRVGESYELANLDKALYRYRVHTAMASIARRDLVINLGRQARDEAIGRRIKIGWAVGRTRERHVTYMERQFSRSDLALRYSWWAAGCRLATPDGSPSVPGRSLSDFIQLTAISLLLDPGCRSTWNLLKRGFVRRIRQLR